LSAGYPGGGDTAAKLAPSWISSFGAADAAATNEEYPNVDRDCRMGSTIYGKSGLIHRADVTKYDYYDIINFQFYLVRNFLKDGP
jgi:hypothetical protein